MSAHLVGIEIDPVAEVERRHWDCVRNEHRRTNSVEVTDSQPILGLNPLIIGIRMLCLGVTIWLLPRAFHTAGFTVRILSEQ